MKVVCSYCSRHLGEKAPRDDQRISHGMCDECRAYFERQIDGLPLDRYLDGFEAPVMIVDGDGRLVASNEMAATMCGKSQKELIGLLGGEAMECGYARLPGGCGRTVHCETCTIRNAVTATLENRQGLPHAGVKLKRENEEIQMTIGTTYIGGMVRIVILS